MLEGGDQESFSQKPGALCKEQTDSRPFAQEGISAVCFGFSFFCGVWRGGGGQTGPELPVSGWVGLTCFEEEIGGGLPQLRKAGPPGSEWFAGGESGGEAWTSWGLRKNPVPERKVVVFSWSCQAHVPGSPLLHSPGDPLSLGSSERRNP